MKKIIILFLTIICLTSCTTNSKFEKAIGENNYGFGWNPFNSDGIVCEELANAISFDDNVFVTKDGKVFKFNYNKLFSNDKNCIEYEYGSNNASFIYKKGIYSKDKTLLLAIGHDNEILTVAEYKNQIGYPYLTLPKEFEEDFDYISYNYCNSAEIIYIKNQDVYTYKIDENDNKEKILLLEIPKDEKVIYLNYAFIKTDKNYYVLSTTNEEECNKYVDVKCEVAFVRSSLSDFYDKVLFATQEMILDNNYYLYGKGTCFGINS